ncbi:hypothetical protein [Acaryochloris marina]|uniref:hypothetical protein n=1 Tax=Acaryochloris marina TaxID=155978 RepID=UPI0011D12FFA|nr:hypothetical protein [Acaryochloris marina]
MKHLTTFFQGCSRTFLGFTRKFVTPKRAFLFVVVLLQFLILQRVSNPDVGDYQAFSQSQGARNGAEAQQIDPNEAQARIASFAANLIKSGYDWQPGQMVQEGQEIYPRNFYLASLYFDMESDLRQNWLLTRARSYERQGFSFDKFLKGKYLSTVELSGNPQVKKLSKSQWQVDVRGVRVAVATDKNAKGAAFKEKLSFTFRIQEQQPRTGHEWGLEQSTLTQALNKFQTDGLKIIEYREEVR